MVAVSMCWMPTLRAFCTAWCRGGPLARKVPKPSSGMCRPLASLTLMAAAALRWLKGTSEGAQKEVRRAHVKRWTVSILLRSAATGTGAVVSHRPAALPEQVGIQLALLPPTYSAAACMYMQYQEAPWQPASCARSA